MVALVAPLSLTVKASLSSKVLSAQTWTVMVLLGSLGAQVRVPVWLLYSCVADQADLHSFPTRRSSDLVVKPTVTDWVVAPVLVTVKVKAVVPPVLPSAWLTSSIASAGGIWRSTIVTPPTALALMPSVAPLSLTVKASLSSKVVSAQTWTVMVLVGSLGAKVSVPVWLL